MLEMGTSLHTNLMISRYFCLNHQASGKVVLCMMVEDKVGWLKSQKLLVQTEQTPVCSDKTSTVSSLIIGAGRLFFVSGDSQG